ncbi:MAG TPA: HD domain-containing protein [Dehalococcoidales bacterium]|jgi:putative hydrolase of HD superfamily
MVQDRFRQQIEFLVEIDKLKNVIRRSYLSADPDRRENSAEHSWHVMVMATILKEYCQDSIDIDRVLKMLLIHDIVEIDAGDVSVYKRQNPTAIAEKEKNAAGRIFGLLPPDQRQEFLELWNEFEARSTADARFARSVDRLEPLIQNYYTQGKTWRLDSITYEKVVEINQKIVASSPTLWEFASSLIEDSVKKGYLIKE